jgi:hypothetical protein
MVGANVLPSHPKGESLGFHKVRGGLRMPSLQIGLTFVAAFSIGNVRYSGERR